MPWNGDRPVTNQSRPVANDLGAAAAERLAVAHAAHTALKLATSALDRLEATGHTEPATDPAYRSVLAGRFTARAALSAALHGLHPSPATLD